MSRLNGLVLFPMIRTDKREGLAPCTHRLLQAPPAEGLLLTSAHEGGPPSVLSPAQVRDALEMGAENSPPPLLPHSAAPVFRRAGDNLCHFNDIKLHPLVRTHLGEPALSAKPAFQHRAALPGVTAVTSEWPPPARPAQEGFTCYSPNLPAASETQTQQQASDAERIIHR